MGVHKITAREFLYGLQLGLLHQFDLLLVIDGLLEILD